MMSNRRVYHITSRSSKESISQNGVDPSYARGGYKSVWVCGRNSIEWAALHVAYTRMVEVDSLVMARLLVPYQWLIRTGRPHVWRLPERFLIPPKCITSWEDVDTWVCRSFEMK